jgi:hypothetical protein
MLRGQGRGGGMFRVGDEAAARFRAKSRRRRAPRPRMRQHRAMGTGLRTACGGGAAVSRVTEEREHLAVSKIAKCGARERGA